MTQEDWVTYPDPSSVERSSSGSATVSNLELSYIKQIPILEIAARLEIVVTRGKAMCFMGHDKHTPSLTFKESKNTWKCFGACGKSGDGIALVMERNSCDFKSALAWFAAEFRVEVGQQQSTNTCPRRIITSKCPSTATQVGINKRERQPEFVADTEVYTWLAQKCRLVRHPLGVDYLERHGIPCNTADQFGVRELLNPRHALNKLIDQWGSERVLRSGLAWGDTGLAENLIWKSYTILFPFYVDGTVTYLQGRPLRISKQKFLGLRGIAKPMYNSESLAALASGVAVHLCEGIPDAIALEARGLHAVAILGASSFRVEWIDRLLRFDIRVVGDGDVAGKTFNQMIRNHFRARAKPVLEVNVPAGKDAADVIAALKGQK